MNHKIGRNDPCPCGSGKKHKHCCMYSNVATKVSKTKSPHDGAITRALAWLTLHHGKAFTVAVQAAILKTFTRIFDDEDEMRAALSNIDANLHREMEINFNEWMLAEGKIKVKGKFRLVSELLLDLHGPLLSIEQRAWLQQLAQRPLRLYDVTNTVPGATITLCDALETEQPPIVVTERTASHFLRVGMKFGARILHVGDEYQLSGAGYPFGIEAGRLVEDHLRTLEAPDTSKKKYPHGFSELIMAYWLTQFFTEIRLPKFVDYATKESLVFVTDHYAVHDWDALSAALASQPDVEGHRHVDWVRWTESKDGLKRPLATLTPNANGKRLSIKYQTMLQAQEGRAWFDALAGNAVKFMLQEVSDPTGAHATSDTSSMSVECHALPTDLEDMSPAGLLEAGLKRYYANWADEPIPALNNQTPRQAIQTAAGLERVKGLLRSYEESEARSATEQNRRAISFQFLWDSLELSDDA